MSDILDVVISENEIDPAVETVKNLIPVIRSTETEISEMEYDIIRANHIVPVSNDGLVHLTDSLEWPVAVWQYVGMVEMGVGSVEQTGRTALQYDVPVVDGSCAYALRSKPSKL